LALKKAYQVSEAVVGGGVEEAAVRHHLAMATYTERKSTQIIQSPELAEGLNH
jgi:hypothetical protein